MIKTAPRGIVILGSGGFAREVYQYICDYINYHNLVYFDIYFVDDDAQKDEIEGVKVVSFDKIPKPKVKNGKIEIWQFIVGVEEMEEKKQLVKKAKDYGLESSISLIHPSAVVQKSDTTVDPLANIGVGGVIGPNVFVSCDAKIGDYVVINPNATIRYNSKIGSYYTIDSGLNLKNITYGEI